MTRRVDIARRPGGGVGPLFSREFRLPILEGKKKLVLRRLGFGGKWGYQTAYRALAMLFESDRTERIVMGCRGSKNGVSEEEEKEGAWKRKELHGREVNDLWTCLARETESHQGEWPQCGTSVVVVGINPDVWFRPKPLAEIDLI